MDYAWLVVAIFGILVIGAQMVEANKAYKQRTTALTIIGKRILRDYESEASGEDVATAVLAAVTKRPQ